jgi:preprotein translocase subunit SecB
MSNEQTPQTLRVIAQYLKDLSFENPGQGSLARSQGGQPEININIQVNTKKSTDNNTLNSVDIVIKAISTLQNNPLFILEVTYTGIFEIMGFTPEVEEQITNIQCPALLFPFIRRIVSETTVDGGYPPLLIDPIDFHSLYMQKLQEFEAEKSRQQEADAQNNSKIILN